MGISFEHTLDFAHFEHMEELEAACYSREFITPASEAYEWYRQRPHSIVALLEEDRVIGFANLLPIETALFEQILAGSFNDAEMTWEDILPLPGEGLEPNTSFELFLSCIVLAPEWQGRGLARTLLAKAAEPYSEAIQAGRCSRVVVDNVTADGARLSERLGFKFVCESDHCSKIYEIGAHTFLGALSD